MTCLKRCGLWSREVCWSGVRGSTLMGLVFKVVSFHQGKICTGGGAMKNPPPNAGAGRKNRRLFGGNQILEGRLFRLFGGTVAIHVIAVPSQSAAFVRKRASLFVEVEVEDDMGIHGEGRRVVH